MTLEKFVTLVVKQRLGLVEPFLMLGSAIVYEEGDDSDDSLSNSILSPLEKCIGGGIKDGSIVTLGDFRQDITVASPSSPLRSSLASRSRSRWSFPMSLSKISMKRRALLATESLGLMRYLSLFLLPSEVTHKAIRSP